MCVYCSLEWRLFAGLISETQDVPSKEGVKLRFWIGRRIIALDCRFWIRRGAWLRDLLFRDAFISVSHVTLRFSYGDKKICYSEMRSSLFCILLCVFATPMSLAERCILATPMSLAGRCDIRRRVHFCFAWCFFAFWLCHVDELSWEIYSIWKCCHRCAYHLRRFSELDELV